MAEAQFPWDELLELIANDQRTVPIIGPELSTLPAAKGVTFETYAAQRVAEKNGVPIESTTTFSQLAAQLAAKGRHPVQISRELSHVHRELLRELTVAKLPESLRLIADIRDFPLLISATPDALLAASFRVTRERDPGTLVNTLTGLTDLPRNWEQGPRPTLFHLFGRINAVPDYALTEEDLLEFLHRLQSEAHRPEQLFDELRTRHLLLIGLRLPDWAMRLLLRALHGSRLSEDTSQTLVLAGESVPGDRALVTFLRQNGRRVWVYEEGDGADFVRELHKRWQGSQEEGWSTTVDGRAVPAEPADIVPGAVYLSAARADRAAAERLAALLDEAGLEAWYDRNDLQEGPRYERRIRHHLQQCDLFVPLLSTTTNSASGSFFQKEWQWALEREASLLGENRLVLPLWIGDDATSSTLPTPLQGHPLHQAPGGQPTPEFVHACVEAVRLARAERQR